MKKENMRMMVTFSIFGLIGMLVGCNGNLSHNQHSTGALASAKCSFEEESKEAEREAEREAEISMETSKYKVDISQSYKAETIVTSTYICSIETTEQLATTTTEEIPTTTTMPIVEPITSAETEPQTVEQTVVCPGYTSDEILLMQIASCEAYSQGAIGQALVMRVVLNRVSLTGSSVPAVIYAPNQFASVNTALFASGYISADAYSAIDLIRNGWDESQGALYFIAARTYRAGSWFSTLTHLFTYGDHMFFK